MVKANLTDLNSLQDAYKNIYGVFVVTNFWEGAKEISEMLAYFEAHTYMGPDSEARIRLAKEVATENFKSLNEWIKQNN